MCHGGAKVRYGYPRSIAMISTFCYGMLRSYAVSCVLTKGNTLFRSVKFAKEKYFNDYSDTRSVQENFNFITSFTQDSADKYILSRTSRFVSSVAWITPEIRRKICRKNVTHANVTNAKAKKTGSAKLDLNLKT